MAALQCEFCGGKLITKAGGICECDSCGMEYDKTWVKEKIQEIKGTVKVEGTVQVAGTVKIDGPIKVEGSVNLESLLKRANMALADKEWEEAEKYFDEALNIDAERGECHFGLLCAQYEQPDVDSLLKNEYAKIRKDNAFKRALAFADEKIRQQVAALEKQFETERSAQQAQSGTQAQELEPLRAKLRPAQHLVCCTEKVVVAVKTDGTLLTATSGYLDRNNAQWCRNLCEQLSTWENIVAVSASFHSVVGLKADGTVVAASQFLSHDKELDVSEWRDIAAVAAGRDRTIGLKKDGRVVVTGKRYEPDPLTKEIKFDLSSWKNIADINCYSDADVGIRKDGTAVIGGHIRKSEEAERIGGWKNIVSIAPSSTGWGAEDFVGLCVDGSLQHRRGNTGGLGIIGIYAGGNAVFALDKDGNILKVRWDGKTENYLVGENIVAMAIQELDLICLKADGTLIRCTRSGIRRDFEGWKLFENVETIEQERKQCAEEKVRRIEAEKADAYQKGLDILNTGNSESELVYAIQLFDELNDYRDAKDKKKQCQVRLGEVKKDTMYNLACAQQRRNLSSDIREAQNLFQKLENWRDSAERLIQCAKKLEKLNQREALLTEKKKLENERENLGLFSGKRKKEIASEILQIDNELTQLEKELK